MRPVCVMPCGKPQAMQLTDSQRQTLASLADEMDMYLAASEDEPYAPSITKDPVTFGKLTKLESRMETDFKRYFKDLAPRLTDAVSWATYRRKVADDDADPMIKVAMETIEQDEKLLIKVAFDFFAEAELIGIQAGVVNYNIPVDFQSLQQVIQRQAIRYSNKFVSDISDTTRSQLRQALRLSIDLGETVDEAQARVAKVIDNPVRARMIARTEPVNSYGRGILVFGENTGAKKKVIDAVIDDRTSQICLELQRKYGQQSQAIDIKKPYTWAANGGGSKTEPGFHVKCRTGHYLLY